MFRIGALSGEGSHSNAPTGQSGIFKLDRAVKGAEERDCSVEGVCFLTQSGGRGGAKRSDWSASSKRGREPRGEREGERGGATRQSLCHEVTFCLELRWKEKTQLLAFEEHDARSLESSRVTLKHKTASELSCDRLPWGRKATGKLTAVCSYNADF